MAIKPPPISEVMQQVNELVGPKGFADEVDRNARQLVQSALRKLDFVSREEFDAQSAVLERTRAKIAALEGELAALTDMLKRLESQSGEETPR
ncbi:MAG: accessory factor UbiK family protein [Pseudomonadota bacterium]